MGRGPVEPSPDPSPNWGREQQPPLCQLLRLASTSAQRVVSKTSTPASERLTVFGEDPGTVTAFGQTAGVTPCRGGCRRPNPTLRRAVRTQRPGLGHPLQRPSAVISRFAPTWYGPRPRLTQSRRSTLPRSRAEGGPDCSPTTRNSVPEPPSPRRGILEEDPVISFPGRF